MTVKYNISPRKDPRNQESDPRYYATVKSTGRVDTYGLARTINSMSTVSSADTAAVLEAFLNVVPDQLAEGRIVELGDFGSFRLTVSSEGAPRAEDFTSRHITDVRVIFTPGKRFKGVLNNAEFQKIADN